MAHELLEYNFIIDNKLATVTLYTKRLVWSHPVGISSPAPSELMFTDNDRELDIEKNIIETNTIIGVDVDDYDNDNKVLTIQFIHATGDTEKLVVEKLQLRVQNSEEYKTLQTWKNALNAVVLGEGYTRPKNLLIFVNPKSGKSKSVEIFENQLAPIFQSAGVSTDVIITEDENHADRVLGSYDLTDTHGIISMGGDGSFWQVLSAYYQRFARDKGVDMDDINAEILQTEIPLGAIPGGTGCLLANVATGTKDPVTAVLHIIQGKWFDKGGALLYNGGIFFGISTLVVCIGYLYEVLRKSESFRALGFPLRYITALVAALWQHKSRSALIEMNTPDDKGHDSVQTFRMNFIMFMMSLNDPDLQRDMMNWATPKKLMSIFHSHGTRKQTFDTFLKILNSKADFIEDDGGWYKCKSFKLTLQDDFNYEQDGIILDGEMKVLSHKELHVKYVPKLFKMFGKCHPYVNL